MGFRSRPTAPFRDASDCRDLDPPLLVIRRQSRSHGAVHLFYVSLVASVLFAPK
jgi:hypothetical protein